MEDTKPMIHWTVTLGDDQIEVDGTTADQARKRTAYLYNELHKSNYPITILKALCRVKRHEDRRVKNPLKEVI